MTPYVVNIFKAYGSPLPADVTTALLGLGNIFATITFISLEHFVGKRRIYLTVLSGICITSLVIAVYGFVFLPSGYNSFDLNLPVPDLPHPALVYIPTICLIVWSFCSFCGIYMMPWQLLSEIFAFKWVHATHFSFWVLVSCFDFCFLGLVVLQQGSRLHWIILWRLAQWSPTSILRQRSRCQAFQHSISLCPYWA